MSLPHPALTLPAREPAQDLALALAPECGSLRRHAAVRPLDPTPCLVGPPARPAHRAQRWGVHRSAGRRVGIAALLAALPMGSAQAADWERIGEKGGVTTYLRPLEGEPIQAVRGVITADLPACQLISFYADPELATTWVDMLVDVQLVELEAHRSLLWQKFDMPWPVADRDFLLEISVTRASDQSVVVSLASTTDPRFPEPAEAVVRGRMSPSTWTFTRVSASRTTVEMVGHVDPSGAFPPWLVNLIQQNFPYNTLSTLVREAGKAEVALRPECASW